MGGFVGDVLGDVGDAIGGAVETAAPYAGLIGGVLGGPLGAAVGTAIGGSLVGSPQTRANMGNVLGGGLNLYGNMVGSRVSKDAIQAAQEEARRAGREASAMAQFRPVGITTRFGASQFQVDPVTGQLVSAGYTTTPEIQKAQERLMGLGAGYLAQTPEQVAADYMARQQELLAPSRERQLAQLQNQLYQTGRGGLSVGATGARPSGAAGLGATTPEMEAYYNALAQQDAALAAQAQQAGQQQVGFGAGLFGKAGELETLAQQPLSLSSQLAQLASGAGARAGQLGLYGGLDAARYGLSKELQYSPTASVLEALTSPTSTFGQGVSGLFGGSTPLSFGDFQPGGSMYEYSGYGPISGEYLF